MRITLILTPNKLNPNLASNIIKEDHSGLVPPLNLMSVAALFEAENVEVQLIDMVAEQLTYSDTLERINKFSPDLLGFTLSTTSFHPVLNWITRFKEDSKLPVIVGGQHVKYFCNEIMTYPVIDYAVIGEGEIIIPQFIRAFKNNKDFFNLKSLAWRDKNNDLHIDTTLQEVLDIDSVPLPSRHLIKNELYYSILSQKKHFTAMLSARGCPYRCTFCDQKAPQWRERTSKSFVQEIKNNYEKYGIRDFDIYDSTFTANKKRVVEICDEIEKSGLDVGWTIRSRVDSVNEEVLQALKRGGCHTIMYGIESSNPEILKTLKKQIRPDKIKKVINYTHDLGINILGFFMLGAPGETLETIEDTIKFSLELPLQYAQYAVVTPYPDTELYEYYQDNGLEDYWSEYTKDSSKERKIELMGTDLKRDYVEGRANKAWRQFYFRPHIIWNQARKISSFSRVKRLVNGAIDVLRM